VSARAWHRPAVWLGLIAVAAVCSSAPQPAQWPEETLSGDVDAKARFSYGWAARARDPEHPGERASLLEQRVGAFARRVERAREGAVLPPPVEFDGASLQSELYEIIGSIEPEALVSVHVRDLLSGRTLFDHRGDAMLNAASNHKILTASAAIELLGPDYVFETDLSYDEGTLYVRGQGDPTLDADGLGVLVRGALEEIGQRPIERVVVDDSAFSSAHFAPGFDPGGVGVSYQAPSGALSLNFNTVEVIVYPVVGEARPAVRVEPESTRVKVFNRARVTSRESLSVKTRPGRDADGPVTEIVVNGTLKKTGTAREFRRRVVDPGLFAGGAVAQLVANERDGDLPRVERGLRPEGVWEVAYRASPPLLEVTSRVLAWSNNFIAEQLLRTLGWRLTGDPGDWDNGGEVLARYWSALGQSSDNLRFQNGSGLSRDGRVSAEALVDLISLTQRASQHDVSVLDALPLAGEAGTLRARLRNSGKRVRAKTGTLDGVSALSGVVTDEAGSPQVAFSIISNNRDGEELHAGARKRMEDRVVTALLQHIDDWELRWAIEILEAEEVRPSTVAG
jgi:D-alanyl-D-alanine carboxypeptidase/D-alanyl-D-alanine-endopeptidase (penicillin-binding protein 4)